VSTASALIIAGIPAAVFVIVQLVRTRVVDPIGAITLYGFTVGAIASVALGGNAYVLKIREVAFEIPFAIACLISISAARRPVMFYLAKTLSAGADKRRQAAYDELYELPMAAETFARITLVWGTAMILHATALILLALALPTGAFLLVAAVIAAAFFGGLITFTFRYSARSRTETAALLAEMGLEYPSVPEIAVA
jgi:Flp pilus assembly protein TadB